MKLIDDYGRLTDEFRDEVWALAFPGQKAPPRKPKLIAKPAPAKQAEERWSKPKPLAAVVQEEAATNAALVERLRLEREAALAEQERRAKELRIAAYQAEIDRVWSAQRAMQESLSELRWDPTGIWGPQNYKRHAWE